MSGGIATFADLIAGTDFPYQSVRVGLANINAVSGRPTATWKGLPTAGPTPTTAVTLDRTSTGALKYFNPASAGNQCLAEVWMACSSPGLWWLCDRLSHQGGIVGNVDTAQTTNLPTAALPRFTSGDGVRARLEIYTVIGTTNGQVQVEYTDDGGNTGQVSPLFDMGATGFREVGRCLMVPMLAGDRGVRAVANVDLVATTGTAGNFGVTLFKPLAQWNCFGLGGWENVWSVFNGLAPLTQLPDDACLELIGFPESNVMGTANIELRIVEN